MNKLARFRHAEKRIARLQRRVWLAQLLMWPTIIVGAVVAVGAVVWFMRHRSAAGRRGRHELPNTPGAHEAGIAGAPSSM